VPSSLFPVLLALHIALAVSLFLPSVLLPFTLRTSPAGREPGTAVRTLLWLQANGTLIIGVGLALTGIGLVMALGAAVLRQPWLLTALGVYALNLAVAFFIQRPTLRRLFLRSADRADDATWRRRARRQRYVSYAMAGAIGLIGFLMSTKPTLW